MLASTLAAVVFLGGARVPAQSPEALLLLPPEAVSVLAVDLARVRALGGPFAPLGAMLGQDAALDRVDRVLLASPPNAPAFGAQPVLAIFEGRFDPGWKAPAWVRSSEMGLEVVTGNLAVAGRPEALRAGLERFRLAPAGGPWPGLLAVVPADAAAWVYTRDPAAAWSKELEALPGGAGPWAALLQSMRGLALAASPAGNRVRLELAGECSTDRDAGMLADAVTAAASFAAFALAPKEPLLAQAVREAKVARQGRLVRLSFELSETEIPGILSTVGQ